MWSPQGTGSHYIMVVLQICSPQHFAQHAGKCLPNPSAHAAKPCFSPGRGGLGSVTTSRNVVLASPWTKYELAESWVRKRHFSQHIENCSSSLRKERSTYSEIDV